MLLCYYVTMAARCAAGRKSVQYFRLTTLPGWKTSATLSQGRSDELSLSFCSILPTSVAGGCTATSFTVRPPPEADLPVPRRRGRWGPGTQAAACGIFLVCSSGRRPGAQQSQSEARVVSGGCMGPEVGISAFPLVSGS